MRYVHEYGLKIKTAGRAKMLVTIVFVTVTAYWMPMLLRLKLAAEHELRSSAGKTATCTV